MRLSAIFSDHKLNAWNHGYPLKQHSVSGKLSSGFLDSRVKGQRWFKGSRHHFLHFPTLLKTSAPMGKIWPSKVARNEPCILSEVNWGWSTRRCYWRFISMKLVFYYEHVKPELLHSWIPQHLLNTIRSDNNKQSSRVTHQNTAFSSLVLTADALTTWIEQFIEYLQLKYRKN